MPEQNLETIVENYIKYVTETIEKFSDIGKLITEDDNVSPDRINTSLAMYLNISLALNAEYQRKKIEEASIGIEYQLWYDEKFAEAKILVKEEYENTKSIKPSVKEFEVCLRRTNREEWKAWEIKKVEVHSSVRFLMRLRDTLNRYDNILTTLSRNSQSEMRTLSMDDRANSNANWNTVNKNTIRKEFSSPSQEPVKRIPVE